MPSKNVDVVISLYKIIERFRRRSGWVRIIRGKWSLHFYENRIFSETPLFVYRFIFMAERKQLLTIFGAMQRSLEKIFMFLYYIRKDHLIPPVAAGGRYHLSSSAK